MIGRFQISYRALSIAALCLAVLSMLLGIWPLALGCVALAEVYHLHQRVDEVFDWVARRPRHD